MKYRRVRVQGGTYFFTLVTYERRKLFASDEIVRTLTSEIQRVEKAHPFQNVALVILPDHLHAIWTLPEDDTDFSMRWRLIKANFTRTCSSNFGLNAPIWQNRFWEHLIRDETDLRRHVDYIHVNPLKHGLVQAPGDWPYSSIHRYIREGLLPADWGKDVSFNFETRIGHE